jgi:hypothetical protein
MICGKSIRCNSVSPGLMLTEWGNKFPEAKVKATTVRSSNFIPSFTCIECPLTVRDEQDKSALKSLATPEDVADQVKTMVLSKSMTGQNVVVCQSLGPGSIGFYWLHPVHAICGLG